MATFLQLVNQVRSEAGIGGGTDLTTLQSGLSAESTRVKAWVVNECKRIESQRNDWQWLRHSGVLTLTANQAQYTVAQCGAASTPIFTAAQFANWKKDSFRVYSDAAFADEMLTVFMPWDTYRNVYQYASMRSTYSRPVAFSIGPDKSLWFGTGPDAAWKVVYEYYQQPTALSADADVPALPIQYHDLIVFRALRAYGVFMSAQEVVDRAQQQINEIQPQLMGDQLPIMMSGPPLA